jgi:triacylglycerol esterase/lipase EstA (alpha/beta hydrolase family)
MRFGVVVIAVCALAWAAAPASALSFAPPDTPGAPLSVPQDKLAAALTCSAGVANAGRAPVLLVQGTGATAKDNWSWTYEPALDKLSIPWCQIDLPDHATGDVQVNGEYVVSAIRTMFARAGRRIAIIGHSQGGMLPRWALRFWPDTRSMVDDVIGFAPSNHGTTTAAAACGGGSCSAADWQQWDISNFNKALNSAAETWSGISYTDVYTHTDEIVQPNSDNSGSSSLHTGAGRITNVAIQDICPADTNEHLQIGLTDPVAYALAVDALNHDGPADPARVDRAVCAQQLQPGVNQATYPSDAAAAAADFESYQARQVSAEPPLACYTTASCPRSSGSSGSSGSGSSGSPGPGARCTRRARVVVHLPRLRRLRVRVDGRRAHVRVRHRRRTVTIDLRRSGSTPVKVVVTGRTARGHRVRIRKTLRGC